MDQMFDRGSRVQTPYGAGTVVYRRMGAPCYERPEAYSVKLDGKEHAGTMVRAELVVPLVEELLGGEG